MSMEEELLVRVQRQEIVTLLFIIEHAGRTLKKDYRSAKSIQS